MASGFKVVDKFELLRAGLRKLKPAGPDGFEGLATALVEKITDGRLKLLQSGTQGGGDAVSDAAADGPRRAIQSKRYAHNTALSAVGLSGELTEAVSAYPGLDVWIVPTTRDIAGQPHEALTSTAGREGISYIAIDWPRAVTEVPPLAALCAADPELSGRWLGQDLEHKLEQWAKQRNVAEAVVRLRQTLTRVDVGLEPLADASAARLDAVFENSGDGGALVGPSARFLRDHPLVARPLAEAALATALSAERVVVVLGDEGTGKTWTTLKALRQRLAAEPRMVLCLLRAQVSGGGADIIDAVVRSLVDLGERGRLRHTDPHKFWRRRLRLWASLKDRPRFLVYLDGLDEGPASFDLSNWLAPAFAEPWAGLFQLVITSRPWEWGRRDRLRSLAFNVTEVTLGLFTEAERDAFLLAHDIDRSSLSAGVLKAALHPRTAFHVVRLKDELPDIDRLTREQLLLADYRHRGEMRSGLPLTDVEFGALVARFGGEAQRRASAQALFSLLPGEAVDVAAAVSVGDRSVLERVLSDLIGGRWWKIDPLHPERLVFTDEALPDAVGAALASELRGQSPDEVRRRAVQFLEPWGADDTTERVLRMCAVILVLDHNVSDDVCEVILDLWQGQPRRQAAEDFWWRLHAVRIGLFLRYCEAHGGGSSDFTLEWSIGRAWEIYPEVRPAIEARLNFWVSNVPLPHAHVEARVLNRDRRRQSKRAARLARLDLSWLNRLGREDSDSRGGPRLAGRILQFMPIELLTPIYVLWAVTMAASGRRCEYELLAWLLRRAREPGDVAAVETSALALQHGGDRLAREAGSLLLNALGTGGSFAEAQFKEPSGRGRRRVEESAADHCLHRQHPRVPGEPDRFLLADLTSYAERSDLALDADLAREVFVLASGAGPESLAGWLEFRSVDYLTTLWRWAPERLAPLLAALINKPDISFEAIEEACRLYLPLAPSGSYSEVAVRLRARADALVGREAHALKGLALAYELAGRPFKEQIVHLSANMNIWPERISNLVNPPSPEEAQAEIERLTLADAETQVRFLEVLQDAIKQLDECHPLLDLDLSLFLTSPEEPVRREALALASHIRSAATRRQLMVSGWRADQENDPLTAFYGSHLLSQDETLTSEDLATRITPELCLLLLSGSRDPNGRALARVVDWANSEANYSGPRTFGNFFVVLNEPYRKNAFDSVVASAHDRTVDLLGTMGADGRTVSSIAFASLDGPLMPLFGAAARAGLPGIVRTWRDAVSSNGGFYRSSALDHLPAQMPEGEAFDAAREEMIARAKSDDDYRQIACACHEAGRQDFLLAWIRSRWASVIGFDQARALTFAAFLEPTAGAKELWAELKPPQGGWILAVFELARDEWLRSNDCVFWRDRFVQAEDEASAAAAYALWVATRDGRQQGAVGDGLKQRRWRRAWVNFDAERRDSIRKKLVEGFSKSIVFSDRCERDIYWPAI